MKKSTLLLLIVFLFNAADSKAQSFMHGIGLNYLFLNGNGNILGNYGGEYNPRYNFVEKGSFSVSAGSHVGLSVSGSVSSRGGSSLSYFIVLPVLAQINFGGYSTYEKDGFGGYAEIGYALALSQIEGFGGTVNGPMFGAGVRFNSRLANEAGFYIIRPVGENSDLRTFGLRVTRNIGSFNLSRKKEVEEILPQSNILDGQFEQELNEKEQSKEAAEEEEKDNTVEEKDAVVEEQDIAVEEKKPAVRMTAKEKKKAQKDRLKERKKARKQREKEMKARAKARKKR